MTRALKPKLATPMTQEVADKIRKFKAQGLYNHQIAAELNINQGRVSEVVTGKRFPEDKPKQRDLFD